MKSGKNIFSSNTAMAAFTLLFLIAGSVPSFAVKTGHVAYSRDGKCVLELKWREPSRLIVMPSAGESGYATEYAMPTMIKAAALSDDSRYVVAIIDDDNKEKGDSISVYDIAQKKRIGTMPASKLGGKWLYGDVWFSPDSAFFYSDGRNGAPISKVNIFTGELTNFEKVPGMDSCAIIRPVRSPDGKYLAVEVSVSHWIGNSIHPELVPNILVYDLATMKFVAQTQADVKYVDNYAALSDLYFSDDSKSVNFYFSAPVGGISNLFNLMYKQGTRRYSVPELKLEEKEFVPRAAAKPFVISGKSVTRTSDGKTFLLSTYLNPDFVTDDPSLLALKSAGKNLTSDSSKVYSGFPPDMKDSLRRAGSGNGIYTNLKQVIVSTNTRRADARPSDIDLSIYGSIQYSGVKTDAGYKVFLSPYLFIWGDKQSAQAKADTTPRIRTETVSVGGMNAQRQMQFDLRVEVTYVEEVFMAGSLDLRYKKVRSAVVREYRFTGFNADWTKLNTPPSAYLVDDRKKWNDKDAPLFQVKINLLDIWFSLRGFKVD